MAETELGLVPEIYYDVIARLCAGVPFVAIALRYSQEPTFNLLTREYLRSLPAVTLAVAVVFASYLAGHLLASISAIWNLGLWHQQVLGRFITNLDLATPLDAVSVRALFQEVYRRIDYIATRDSNGGALLKKMEAGAQLSDNLFSGFLTYVVIRLFVTGAMTAREAAAHVAIGAILLVSVILRRLILIGRQDTLLSLIGTSSAVPAQPKALS